MIRREGGKPPNYRWNRSKLDPNLIKQEYLRMIILGNSIFYFSINLQRQKSKFSRTYMEIGNSNSLSSVLRFPVIVGNWEGLSTALSNTGSGFEEGVMKTAINV